MPYGRRKYGRLKRQGVKPVDVSIPNFICPKCKKIRPIDTQHTEITALENKQLLMYTKLCGDCTKLLQEWLKG